MGDWDPAAWGRLTWVFYGVGTVYLAGFFASFWVLRAAERKARSGRPADVAAYNRALRGFPMAFYAKMLGRRPMLGAS